MKKTHTILALGFIVLFVASLSACKNTPKTYEELSDTISAVEKQMESIADDNSNEIINYYILPNEDDFYWTDVENGVSVENYYGTETAIIIPDTLGGKPVVQITPDVFSEIQPTGVKLPDSLIKICDETFYYCTELIEITFGSGLKEVGNSAFEGCISLRKVEFPDSFESIGEMAFANCISLNEVTLPDGLKYIHRGAFGLSGIEKITVPSSVKCIESQAFVSCNSLKEVTIETGVETLEERVFEGCPSLEKCYFPDTVTKIDYNVFHQCENINVYVPKNSFAEQYCKENEIKYTTN